MSHVHPPAKPPDTFSAEALWTMPAPLTDAEVRLRQLTQAIYDDLDVLSYPKRMWDYSRDANILEVAILGAGYSGKSMAFGLRRHGIGRVRIFDRNPAGQEGPWRTYARNATLRTPKEVTGGLDWGMPNLNFRRWCAARYGEAYWQEMRYIPRLMWADYLDWYGKVLDLPLQNDTEIQDITWCEAEQCFWLAAQYRGNAEWYKARFVVFATGMECAGGKKVPAIVRDALPAHCYHHTMDAIAFSQFEQKRVVIIGGGASAFDNAICALKAGAASVDLVIRRLHLPDINRIRWSEWNGYHRHYIDLPDELKWYYSLEEVRLGQLPPSHTYYQAMSYPNFTLYTGAPIKALRYEQGEIVGVYGDRTMHHDCLICGTGFQTNLDRQPELQTLAPYIARWRDHFQPPPGDEHPELANYPYLGKSLEFIPKFPEHDYLRRCYYLSCGATLLSGLRANLSGLQFALPRVTYDIGRQLFLEHQDDIRAAFAAYDVKEY